MLLSEVEYARPDTLAEAIGLLAGNDNARVLAGGQSLVNVMKQRFAVPGLLVDVNRIEELRAIRRTADGGLEIGATATLDAIDRSAEIRSVRPVISHVAAHIADQQVRNRGTIGGNLCLNDPTNNLPPVMAVVRAELEIASLDSARTVGIDDFFLGVYETAVGEGEILTRVLIPPRGPASGDGFAALTMGADGTGIVNVAATVVLDGETIREARIAVGCVSAVPERPSGAEAALAGAKADEESVRAAVAGLGATLDPPSDVHATADFRRHLAEVLSVRAVMQAIEEARAR